MTLLLISEDIDTEATWQQKLNFGTIEIDVVELNPEIVDMVSDVHELILFDVETRDIEALELCAQISSATDAPILFLTHQNQTPQILEIYKAGAADCIIKPADSRIVLLKIHAWLKHTSNNNPTVGDGVIIDDLHLDTANRLLISGTGEPIRLSKNETSLLALLMRNAGLTLSSDLIMQRVWSYSENSTSALRSSIHRLRGKLRAAGLDNTIEYIDGEGYRFVLLSQS